MNNFCWRAWTAIDARRKIPHRVYNWKIPGSYYTSYKMVERTLLPSSSFFFFPKRESLHIANIARRPSQFHSYPFFYTHIIRYISFTSSGVHKKLSFCGASDVVISLDDEDDAAKDNSVPSLSLSAPPWALIKKEGGKLESEATVLGA